jgi:hypothetical protein
MNSKFFATILVLTASTTVFAADLTITFDVPVNIKSYPVPNQSLATWCEIRSAQGQVINANFKHFSLSDGGYSGSQQIRVDYQPEQAVNLKNYRCAILVEDRNGGIGKAIPTNATILSQVNGTFN